MADLAKRSTSTSTNANSIVATTFAKRRHRGKANNHRNAPRQNDAKHARAVLGFLLAVEGRAATVRSKLAQINMEGTSSTTFVSDVEFVPLGRLIDYVADISATRAAKISQNLMKVKILLSFGTGNFSNFPNEKNGSIFLPSVGAFYCLKSIGVQDESNPLVDLIFDVLKQDLCVLERSTTDVESLQYVEATFSLMHSNLIDPTNEPLCSGPLEQLMRSTTQRRHSNNTPTRLRVAYVLKNRYFTDRTYEDMPVVLVAEVLVLKDDQVTGDNRPSCSVLAFGFVHEKGFFEAQKPSEQMQCKMGEAIGSMLKLHGPDKSWSFHSDHVIDTGHLDLYMDEDLRSEMEVKKLQLQYQAQLFLQQCAVNQNDYDVMVIVSLDTDALNVAAVSIERLKMCSLTNAIVLDRLNRTADDMVLEFNEDPLLFTRNKEKNIVNLPIGYVLSMLVSTLRKESEEMIDPESLTIRKNKKFEEDLHEFEDDDVCTECGTGHSKGKNKIIYCDQKGWTCQNKYHQLCLVPVLNNIPKGLWYCPSCRMGTTALETGMKKRSNDDGESTDDTHPKRSKVRVEVSTAAIASIQGQGYILGATVISANACRDINGDIVANGQEGQVVGYFPDGRVTKIIVEWNSMNGAQKQGHHRGKGSHDHYSIYLPADKTEEVNDAN